MSGCRSQLVGSPVCVNVVAHPSTAFASVGCAETGDVGLIRFGYFGVDFEIGLPVPAGGQDDCALRGNAKAGAAPQRPCQCRVSQYRAIILNKLNFRHRPVCDGAQWMCGVLHTANAAAWVPVEHEPVRANAPRAMATDNSHKER
jgi:hypothetical protein